jgi:hypothetical protein
VVRPSSAFAVRAAASAAHDDEPAVVFVGVLEDAFGGIAANQVGGDGDVFDRGQGHRDGRHARRRNARVTKQSSPDPRPVPLSTHPRVTHPASSTAACRGLDLTSFES